MTQNDLVAERLKTILAFLGGLIFFGTALVALTERLAPKAALDKTVGILLLESVEREFGVSGFVEVVILLCGVGALWFAIWNLLDILGEGHLGKAFRKVKFGMKISGMKNHIIICGAGRVGSNIAKKLSEKKKKFVIIEQNEKLVKTLRNKKYIVLSGNCLDENILKKAGIEKASALAAVVGATEKNVYLTLLAKELNPEIEIHARADDEKIAKKLKIVGASQVVMPEVAGAEALAKKILKKK